jgi:hypothetical protein
MRFTRFLAPKSLELLDFRIAVRAGVTRGNRGKAFVGKPCLGSIETI